MPQKQNNLSEFPLWLQQKQHDAISKFNDLGLPSRKSELWKYTNIKAPIVPFESKLVPISIKNPSSANPYNITSSEPISLKNIDEIEQSNWQQIKTDKERVLVEMNTANLTSGFELSIHKNTSIKVHINYKQINTGWENIRTVINIGENAQVELTESYDSQCHINHVSIINAAKDAVVKLHSHKILDKDDSLVHYSQINCAKNAVIKQGIINNNARLSHAICDVNFYGEHSDFTSASVNLVNKTSHIAENIQTNHLVPNCTSTIIKRSLATDNSQITVNAKAVVSIAADGSNISQSLKNILLSDNAKIYSRPELEINTDDVIAAHGATSGQLDEESLNYLRSRGIPMAIAKKMLIESFLSDADIFDLDNFKDLINL